MQLLKSDRNKNKCILLSLCTHTAFSIHLEHGGAQIIYIRVFFNTNRTDALCFSSIKHFASKLALPLSATNSLRTGRFLWVGLELMLLLSCELHRC